VTANLQLSFTAAAGWFLWLLVVPINLFLPPQLCCAAKATEHSPNILSDLNSSPTILLPHSPLIPPSPVIASSQSIPHSLSTLLSGITILSYILTVTMKTTTIASTSLSILFSAASVAAKPWYPPPQTQAHTHQSWTPKPTTAPAVESIASKNLRDLRAVNNYYNANVEVNDLFKRTALPDYVCGFINGDYSLEAACSSTSSCVFNTDYNVMGKFELFPMSQTV
jgi:hypothetical protein